MLLRVFENLMNTCIYKLQFWGHPFGKKVQYGRLNILRISTNEAFESVLSNKVTQNNVVHMCVTKVGGTFYLHVGV